MSRPVKLKFIRQLPIAYQFTSEHEASIPIKLALEEYEAIRLIDYCGYSQADCAKSMGISRTSVVSIYNDARKKLARFLVEGVRLEIQKGEVQMEKNQIKDVVIAVPCIEEDVYPHFGHCPQFVVYTVKDGAIVAEEKVNTEDKGCQLLAPYLRTLNVEIIICSHIGAGAKNNCVKNGIMVYPGANGNAREQVISFLSGSLQYDESVECSHDSCKSQDHSHGHHGCQNH